MIVAGDRRYINPSLDSAWYSYCYIYIYILMWRLHCYGGAAGLNSSFFTSYRLAWSTTDMSVSTLDFIVGLSSVLS